MSFHKYSIAMVIVAAGLLICGPGKSAWGLQEQKSPAPVPDNEKQRLLESLKQKMQQTETRPKVSQTAPKQQQSQPAAPSPAAPQPSGSVERNSGKIRLNMENADLYDFVTQIASILEITPIVIDPEVKGTVTILSSTPMSKEDLFPLFNLILKNNNASLVKEDGTYQIIPISTALKRGIQIIEKLPEPASEKASPKAPPGAVPPPVNRNIGSPLDVFRSLAARQRPAEKAAAKASAEVPEPEESGAPELATHVIRAEFIPVEDLIEPVKLFMTEGGVIMPYERLNMLILTDYTDSASRILKIIRMLDNSYLDPDLIELIKVENNASADVVEDLKKIFGSGSTDSATGISFTSIDRINSIFVIAASKRGLEEVKLWVKQLDAVSGRNIQTYVYVVQNSTASNIAMMLSVLYGGDETVAADQGAAASQAEGGAVAGDRNMQSGLRSAFSNQSRAGATSPFSGQSQYGGGYGSFGEGGVFTTGQRLGPRLNVQPTVSSQILRGGEFSGLQDTVRMVVDGINNRLIIQATAADYAYISDTIKKMDVLPRQVIIDARVFEIDLNKSLSFGVNAALQGRTTDPADHITSAGFNTGLNAEEGVVGLSASTFAFVGDSREILMRINALRLKTNVRILQAPSVLALDGQPASILVGSEIPYAGGSYTTSTGGSTTSVQYRETGVSLLVLPRISASGSVTLNITQEVSSPGSTIQIGNSETPSFSVSKVETTLSVKDGETVAIAGIIQDSDNFDRVGIPFLSDIPVLGYLFGRTIKDKHRKELIILITPHVISTVEGFQRMSQELKDSLRNVRKFADEKERELRKDMEDARKDRYKQKQESLEKE